MTDFRSVVDFARVQSEKDAERALSKIISYSNQSASKNQKSKQPKLRIHQILTLMHTHLTSKEADPLSKFYTLFILKLVTQKDQRNVLSVLTSHSLLKYMQDLAQNIDPYSPIQDKGKSLFKDKQLGNDYIRLILESLKVWGEKFSSNKRSQPSHFKKTYDYLIKNKIVMPTQLKFYDPRVYNPLGLSHEVSQNQVKTTKRIQSARQMKQTDRAQPESIKTMTRDMGLIRQYLAILQGSDYQKHCHEYHKQFASQLPKYQTIINDLVTSNRHEQIQNAISINDFLLQESNAYQQFLVGKQDYYSYVKLVQLKADQLGINSNVTPQSKQYAKREMKVQVTKIMSSDQENKDVQVENRQLVSGIMSKLNDVKSSKALKSFRDIKESLSKEKSTGRIRSVSGLKKSSVSKFGKSLAKSRISQIFTSPPNPNPQQKRYQGQLIPQNRELQTVIKSITKTQGHRRFITSNFKSKQPLFQNAHIQIGFKSQSVYDEVDEFRTVIVIELFIGNKTDSEVNNLSLEYKASGDVLLYGNPKCVKLFLEPGYQMKQELLIVPIKTVFPFINMSLKYMVGGQKIQEKITLPNSIIKLTQNSKISKKEFVQAWNASSIYRTPQFKLTHYIAPDCLTKYLSSLQQLSPYQQFVIKGSQTDYELGCHILLKRKYQGVLRISVRPNLNVVIQLGIVDQSQDSRQGFAYYMQTLQMLLSHVQK